jgi:hypothetical protein
VQNDRSGARTHHKKGEEVLSAADAAALVRGRDLKRCVRAAAALSGLYDDTAIAGAMDIARGTVGGWWDGAQMKPDNIRKLAGVTGLSSDELTRYVYYDGPPPRLPELSEVPPDVQEFAERSESQSQDDPAPRPDDTGASTPRGVRPSG